MITQYRKSKIRPRRSWTGSHTGAVPGWEYLLKSQVRGAIKLHEPLEAYSHCHGGGTADALVFPADPQDLFQVISFAEKNHVPWWVLGSGSRVWIRDPGIHGIVLNLCKSFNRIEILEEKDGEIYLQVEAGVPISQVLDMGRGMKIQGVESLADLSGTVGGAIWTNAGNGSGEIRDSLEAIDVLLMDGTKKTYLEADLKYHYRQIQLPERGVLLSGKFRFTKNHPLGRVQGSAKEITNPSWWLTLAPLWSLLKFEGLPSTRRHDR